MVRTGKEMWCHEIAYYKVRAVVLAIYCIVMDFVMSLFMVDPRNVSEEASRRSGSRVHGMRRSAGMMPMGGGG